MNNTEWSDDTGWADDGVNELRIRSSERPAGDMPYRLYILFIAPTFRVRCKEDGPTQ